MLKKIFLKSINKNTLRNLILTALNFTGHDVNIFVSFNEKSDLCDILSNSAQYNRKACPSVLKELFGNCEYILVLSREFASVLIWLKSENEYKYFYSADNDFIYDFARELKIDTSLMNNVFIDNKIKKYTLNEDNSAQIFDVKKIRYAAHEIKNQLSICDLYSEIIKKYCIKNNINDQTILKSAECIKNASKTAGNSLLELKSVKPDSAFYNVSDLVTEALLLAKVYGMNKNISFTCDKTCDAKIFADKHRFLSVIINLVKNACEAFDDSISSKKVSVVIEKSDNFVKILISNNAKPIENTLLIFEEGFTEKVSGSGLGLCICKKNIEEMSGELKLTKSDEISTEFEITIPINNRNMRKNQRE